MFNTFNSTKYRILQFPFILKCLDKKLEGYKANIFLIGMVGVLSPFLGLYVIAKNTIFSSRAVNRSKISL